VQGENYQPAGRRIEKVRWAQSWQGSYIKVDPINCYKNAKQKMFMKLSNVHQEKCNLLFNTYYYQKQYLLFPQLCIITRKITLKHPFHLPETYNVAI
jgi:hypothetical protein